MIIDWAFSKSKRELIRAKNYDILSMGSNLDFLKRVAMNFPGGVLKKLALILYIRPSIIIRFQFAYFVKNMIQFESFKTIFPKILMLFQKLSLENSLDPVKMQV